MELNNQEWKPFVNKIVPICWKLATIYMPPIFVCAQCQVKFDDVYHEKHPKSTKSNTIQSCIFPLVYRDYRGQIHKKAIVVT